MKKLFLACVVALSCSAFAALDDPCGFQVEGESLSEQASFELYIKINYNQELKKYNHKQVFASMTKNEFAFIKCTKFAESLGKETTLDRYVVVGKTDGHLDIYFQGDIDDSVFKDEEGIETADYNETLLSLDENLLIKNKKNKNLKFQKLLSIKVADSFRFKGFINNGYLDTPNVLYGRNMNNVSLNTVSHGKGLAIEFNVALVSSFKTRKSKGKEELDCRLTRRLVYLAFRDKVVQFSDDRYTFKLLEPQECIKTPYDLNTSKFIWANHKK